MGKICDSQSCPKGHEKQNTLHAPLSLGQNVICNWVEVAFFSHFNGKERSKLNRLLFSILKIDLLNFICDKISEFIILK